MTSDLLGLRPPQQQQPHPPAHSSSAQPAPARDSDSTPAREFAAAARDMASAGCHGVSRKGEEQEVGPSADDGVDYWRTHHKQDGSVCRSGLEDERAKQSQSTNTRKSAPQGERINRLLVRKRKG